MTYSFHRQHAKALTNEVLMLQAPSIFAEAPHDSRSDRFAYVSTIEIIEAMREEGFDVFSAGQSACRTEGKENFTKHVIRLRHQSEVERAARIGDGIPEIVLFNAHDGTSAYRAILGWFEFVCSNSLMRGNTLDDIRVAHKGSIIGEIILGAIRLIGKAREIRDERAAMKGIQLSSIERLQFARDAAALRWKSEDENGKAIEPPVPAERLLRYRRAGEEGHDLWTTFNVLQEGLIRGGHQGWSATNRRLTTREVKGVSQSAAINRGLWEMADAWRKAKTAA
jgi:hypothetical protein